MMLGGWLDAVGLCSRETNLTPFIPADLEAAIRSRFVLDASHLSRTRAATRTGIDTDRQPIPDRESGDFNMAPR